MTALGCLTYRIMDHAAVIADFDEHYSVNDCIMGPHDTSAAPGAVDAAEDYRLDYDIKTGQWSCSYVPCEAVGSRIIDRPEGWDPEMAGWEMVAR